ncbi:RNA polymerase sigma-70 factor, ECF subfamily [bacterium A37T11]|nr:RNA polymerase sigma-70 factor, ECF subfamily [bacterium A37T11]
MERTTYRTLPEDQLIALLKQGDESAFNEIYLRYYDFLITYSFKLTGDEQESKDIVQDLFVNLWTNRLKTEITGKLFSYLHQGVRYGFLYRERGKNSTTRFQEGLKHFLKRENNAVDNYILEKELIARLEKLAMTLPGKTGKVFLMTHFGNYSPEEIAKAMGINERTVKNLLSQAVKNMKLRLGLALLLGILLP